MKLLLKKKFMFRTVVNCPIRGVPGLSLRYGTPRIHIIIYVKKYTTLQRGSRRGRLGGEGDISITIYNKNYVRGGDPERFCE